MRTVGGTLSTKLAQGVTQLARIWEVTRTDGVVVRMTDHDEDVVYASNTYRADAGFTASTILSLTGSDVQGVQLIMAAQDDLVGVDDLLANLYVNAQCTLRLLDYTDPDGGTMFLFGGEVRWSELDDEKRLVLEIAGLLSLERFVEVESYSSICRADLGDDRCSFDIDSMKETFTVDVVTNKVKFTTLELNEANDHWALGVLRFTSGNNNGLAMEVRKSVSASKTVEMSLAAPFTVEPGDTGEIWPGCDKSPTMCHSRYSNIINFRGEAFLTDAAITDTRRYTK